MDMRFILTLHPERFTNYSCSLNNAIAQMKSDGRELIQTSDILEEYIRWNEIKQCDLKSKGLDLDLLTDMHPLLSVHLVLTRDSCAWYPDKGLKIITSEKGLEYVLQNKKLDLQLYESLDGLEIKAEQIDEETILPESCYNHWTKAWEKLAHSKKLWSRFLKSTNITRTQPLPIHIPTTDEPSINLISYSPYGWFATTDQLIYEKPPNIFGIDKNKGREEMIELIDNTLSSLKNYFKK